MHHPKIITRKNKFGEVEDHYLHHAIEMKHGEAPCAHCGVRYGHFTDDVAELHANERRCPACTRYHAEAVLEEANAKARKERGGGNAADDTM